MAAGLGLEPRLNVPETFVLPLDDPAIFMLLNLTALDERSGHRLNSQIFPQSNKAGNNT